MARKDSALSPVSSAAVDPWQHSFSKSLGFMSKILHLQSRRRTLTRYNSGLSLPQVRAMLMHGLSFSFSVVHRCRSVLKGWCVGWCSLYSEFNLSAGSKRGAIFCVWHQISQVCAGTPVWPFKFCTLQEELYVLNQRLILFVSSWSSAASLLSWHFTWW